MLTDRSAVATGDILQALADLGPAVREWTREQGHVSMLIEAGRTRDPATGEWLRLGLPFGPKPRLLLAHLNSEAVRTGLPEIEVEGSLSAFVKRLGLDPEDRNMRIIKDQLGRLSAAQIYMAVTYGEDRRQSTDGSSAASISGFPRTTGNALSGRRPSSCPQIISRACSVMPCRSTSVL